MISDSNRQLDEGLRDIYIRLCVPLKPDPNSAPTDDQVIANTFLHSLFWFNLNPDIDPAPTPIKNLYESNWSRMNNWDEDQRGAFKVLGEKQRINDFILN